jgi:hypothetical protein
MAGACQDRTTETRQMAPVQSAPTPDLTHVAGACDWSSVSSVCIEFVAKNPADQAMVLERTGCKSEPVLKPCRREARVGSCQVSEQGRMVEGRPLEPRVREARVVTYHYYADGPQPYTAASAREACNREHGHWLE